MVAIRSPFSKRGAGVGASAAWVAYGCMGIVLCGLAACKGYRYRFVNVKDAARAPGFAAWRCVVPHPAKRLVHVCIFCMRLLPHAARPSCHSKCSRMLRRKACWPAAGCSSRCASDASGKRRTFAAPSQPSPSTSSRSVSISSPPCTRAFSSLAGRERCCLGRKNCATRPSGLDTLC